MRVVIFKTVAVRIIMLMLCYAVTVTSIIIAFGAYIIGTTQQRIHVQSAEANLQLASQNIARDLVEVMALASWCSHSNPPARFLTRPYNPIDAVNSFMRLQEEKRNNRATRYIKRILIVNNDGSKLLHLSDDGSNPLVLPGNSNEKQIEHYPLAAGAEIYGIAPDPYDILDDETVLAILSPVYSTSSASATTAIGAVYMAVDTAIITDSLKGYEDEDSSLFLTIGKQTYRMDHGELSFIKANFDTNRLMTSPGKDISYLDTVRCDIRTGMFLTYRLGREPDILDADSWMPMLFTVCALVLLLSAAVIFTMDRTISRPVARIRKKTQAIAGGDFSPDPGIESDSEIGEVGRSLNQLSRNVIELMEKRLADEQSKRELEYRMLQGQISSHFLYNTLGSIKWMATLQKAHGIAEMTTALSRLLRTTAKDLRKVVPLRDEIALLDDYYTILKYRYGGTIEYEKYIEEDEALLESTLPRFVLQPLMENAVFHGIEPKGKGQLKLHVTKRDGCVCITITDNGVGLSEEEMERISDFSAPAKSGTDITENGFSSVGLHNVHQRIQNVFGGDYGVTVESEENIYTSVTIRVPYTPAQGGQHNV